MIWTAITAFSSRLWSTMHGPKPIAESVAAAIQPSLGLALLFLILVLLVLRWRDVGLNRPNPGTIRLVWFPAIYVVGFVALIGVVGLPPLTTTMILLGNTMLVGVSEELAARGILYRGLRDKLAIWPAALLSSLLFGAVHLVNGFTTGDFTSAGIQSITAFMTGMAFLGIRVRTGSLYPGMILHGLWDFALITAVTGGAARAVADAPSISSGWQMLAPIALILPNFICGMLRGVREREPLPI
ncbi:membrane protease YdiL (CAAX protease family) [Sphingomonas sp. UYAg733]